LQQLVLLANAAYYEKYQASWDYFKTILDRINGRLPENVNIQTQVVDCGTPEIVEAINTLNWDLNWRDNNDTLLYDEIVRLNEEQVIELAQQVGEANLEIRLLDE
jgi:hypothetical protein